MLSVATTAACGTDTESITSCAGDKCDELSSGWVIDLRKTGTYGSHSEYFWGLSLQELGLGALADAIDGSGLEVVASEAFAPYKAKANFKIVWDQLQSVTPGWPTAVFADIDTARANLEKLNNALRDNTDNIQTKFAGMGTKYEEGMEYRLIVIDKQNQVLAVPGGLNIIPMLQNTAPNEQKHIKAALDDGDVISYVHPEDDGMAGLMERRASHVAMHYEEGDTVHHIDNPNGYGPPYNHSPDRHMPFHAFRYQPQGMSPAVAAQHRTAARNWAFITNDLSPFADFFDLRLKKFTDLVSFSHPALNNEETPELYCSGLAYANLNLGISKPLNQAGLGDDYQTFTDGAYYFSDTDQEYGSDKLGSEAGLNPGTALVFEPYTSVDMLNVWISNTFRGVPPALRTQFLPEFLKSPDLHEQIGNSLADLNWSDGERDDRYSVDGWQGVANTFNVAAWATAYGMQVSGKSGSDFANADLELVVDSDGTKKKIKDVVDAKLIVQPSTTPLQVMDALYDSSVENRFVPPRIWIDEGQVSSNNITDAADTPRNMKYLGTVINCELLSPTDGSSQDACAGGGLGVKEYAEGGADTHTYSHYAVTDGGERTHRRINASAGPEFFGPGTVATIRMTGNVDDTRFALHVPEHWLALPDHASDSITEYDRYCNDQWQEGKSCAPSVGILLNPTSDGGSSVVHNKMMKFPLVGGPDAPCTIVDDATLDCQLVDLVSGAVEQGKVSRLVHSDNQAGYFTATMLDQGNITSESDCSIRAELDADNPGAASGCLDQPGSGHYDVFHIKVANQAADDFADDCFEGECFDTPDNAASPGWCEDRYGECMLGGSSLGWQQGVSCLGSVDVVAEDTYGETCDWAYDGNYEENAVPTCYPQGADGVVGRCVVKSLCDAKQQTEDTTGYGGFCPGANDVQCCVGLDIADGMNN